MAAAFAAESHSGDSGQYAVGGGAGYRQHRRGVAPVCPAGVGRQYRGGSSIYRGENLFALRIRGIR